MVKRIDNSLITFNKFRNLSIKYINSMYFQNVITSITENICLCILCTALLDFTKSCIYAL